MFGHSLFEVAGKILQKPFSLSDVIAQWMAEVVGMDNLFKKRDQTHEPCKRKFAILRNVVDGEAA